MRRRKQPKVQKLRKKGDLEGLLAASRYGAVVDARANADRDEGAQARREAVLALADFYGSPVTSAVVRALEDRTPSVRAAAVEAVARLDLVSAHEHLVQGAALWDTPPYGEATVRAVRVLAGWTCKRVPEAYVDHLLTAKRPLTVERHQRPLALLTDADARGPGPARRAVAAHLVGRLSSSSDPDQTEKAEMILRWLGEDCDEAVVEALTGGRTLPALARLAGDLRDVRAVPALLSMVSSPEVERRIAAVGALGKVRDTRAVPALLSATQDPEAAVRDAALRELDSFGVASVVFGLAALNGRSPGDKNDVVIEARPGEADSTWVERAVRHLLDRGG